jgi:predicted Rossmann fold nucleotide-binding protein DprA/Smf involved in DNA uptake
VRLGIVGSREFPNRFLVEETVRRMFARMPQISVISGGARGVDTWAAEEARRCGLDVVEFLPDIEKYGIPQAYFERNTLIAEVAEAILAFWDGRSTGTLDTLRKAKTLGKKIRVVLPDGSEPMRPPV